MRSLKNEKTMTLLEKQKELKELLSEENDPQKREELLKELEPLNKLLGE